uniref:Uncharacterized protein n=1 Tax=Arundo donax TaxID=35708 RepID=A0A0A9EMX6_ARUDO
MIESTVISKNKQV